MSFSLGLSQSSVSLRLHSSLLSSSPSSNPRRDTQWLESITSQLTTQVLPSSSSNPPKDTKRLESITVHMATPSEPSPPVSSGSLANHPSAATPRSGPLTVQTGGRARGSCQTELARAATRARWPPWRAYTHSARPSSPPLPLSPGLLNVYGTARATGAARHAADAPAIRPISPDRPASAAAAASLRPARGVICRHLMRARAAGRVNSYRHSGANWPDQQLNGWTGHWERMDTVTGDTGRMWCKPDAMNAAAALVTF